MGKNENPLDHPKVNTQRKYTLWQYVETMLNVSLITQSIAREGVRKQQESGPKCTPEVRFEESRCWRHGFESHRYPISKETMSPHPSLQSPISHDPKS